MAGLSTFRQALSLSTKPHIMARQTSTFRLSSTHPLLWRNSRLAQKRLISWTTPRSNSSNSPLASNEPKPKTKLSFQAEPRLQISFTCTVKDCDTRSTHEFTKRSYTSGIVIVECPGCKNRHLIADHIGWFKESTQDGRLKTVEDLVQAKGEKVKRGRVDGSGVIEYSPE
ncbi:unnamed protein product [Somion occarium]|uniref:DNL-type domain-containing protein n=1 Tax=Somion occarium TaxID=3059160 RepID=A0ABP1E6W8_9APHY